MLAIVFLQLGTAPQIVFKCRLQFYKRFCPVTQLRFIQIRLSTEIRSRSITFFTQKFP